MDRTRIIGADRAWSRRNGWDVEGTKAMGEFSKLRGWMAVAEGRHGRGRVRVRVTHRQTESGVTRGRVAGGWGIE